LKLENADLKISKKKLTKKSPILWTQKSSVRKYGGKIQPITYVPRGVVFTWYKLMHLQKDGIKYLDWG